MKKLLMLLLCVTILTSFLCLTAHAGSGEYNGYSWEVEDGVLTVDMVEGTGKLTESVYESIKYSTGSTVTSLVTGNGITVVDFNIFVYDKALTSVTLSNVSEIGAGVFFNNTSLKSVSLPETVSVGSQAFQECTALETFSAPKLSSVGQYAFLGCTSLASFDYSNVTEIKDEAFSGCTALQSLSAPKLESIGSKAFLGCNELKAVNLPKLTSLGSSAFENCKALETAGVPQLVNCKSSAFSGCSSLKSVAVSGLAAIPSGMFYGCEALASFDFSAVTALENSCFRGSGISGTIDLSSVKTIGGNAFANCTNLTKVTTSNVLTEISGNAFANCTALTSFYVDCSKSVVSSYAFSTDSGVTVYFRVDNAGWSNWSATAKALWLDGEISGTTDTGFTWKFFDGTLTIDGEGELTSAVAAGVKENVIACTTGLVTGTGITSIGSSAFSTKYSKLVTASLPEVTSIGASAFASHKALKSVTAPELITLGGSAFYNSTALESFVFPKLKTAGSMAFYGCTALSYADISSMESIGTSMFSGCTALKTVVLPELTVIPGSLFYNCAALTAVNLDYSKITEFGSSCFEGTSIPQGKLNLTAAAKIGSKAFSGCTGITEVTFGPDLTEVQTSAFQNCTALTAAYFTGDYRSSYYNTGAFSGCENITLYHYAVYNKWESWTATPRAVWGGSVIIDSGTFYSDGFSWTVTGSGIFTVTGTGAVPDQTTSWTRSWSKYSEGITKIIVESGITELGNYAFATETSKGLGVKSGMQVVLPEGLTRIGKSCFESRGGSSWPLNLSSIDLPSTLETIGDSAFYKCSALQSVQLPSSLQKIGSCAFEYCTALSGELTLPAGISVDYFAFYLTNITGLIMEGDAERFGSSCLPDTIETVVLREGCTVFPECAHSSALTLLEVPLNLMDLGKNAGTEELVVKGWSGSMAEVWAERYGHTFESVGTPEITEVYVENAGELTKALGSFRSITLADGLYRFTDTLDLSKYCSLTLKAEHSGCAEILTGKGYVPVIEAGCFNTLEGLILGHSVTASTYGEGGCDGSYSAGYVLYCTQVSFVTVRECDLFGCGYIAIDTYDTRHLKVEDSVLRDCVTYALLVQYSVDLDFRNCVISGNKTGNNEDCPCLYVNGMELSELKMKDCIFLNNFNDVFLRTRSNNVTEDTLKYADFVENGCRFIANAWQEGETPSRNWGVCLHGIVWNYNTESRKLELGFDREGIISAPCYAYQKNREPEIIMTLRGDGCTLLYSRYSAPWVRTDLSVNNSFEADSIVLKEHHWDAGTEIQKIGCTQEGIVEYHCTDAGCAACYTVTTPCTGHHYETVILTRPSKTDGGSVRVTCEGCGYDETVTLPAVNKDAYAFNAETGEYELDNGVCVISFGLLGDVDGDGDVSLTDVSGLFRWWNGSGSLSDKKVELGDVNEDLFTDLRDASMLFGNLQS